MIHHLLSSHDPKKYMDKLNFPIEFQDNNPLSENERKEYNEKCLILAESLREMKEAEIKAHKAASDILQKRLFREDSEKFLAIILGNTSTHFADYINHLKPDNHSMLSSKPENPLENLTEAIYRASKSFYTKDNEDKKYNVELKDKQRLDDNSKSFKTFENVELDIQSSDIKVSASSIDTNIGGTKLARDRVPKVVKSDNNNYKGKRGKLPDTSEIVERFLKRESQADLAREYGCSREAIRLKITQSIGRNAVKKQYQKWEKDDVSLIISLLVTNPVRTLEELGNETGLGIGRVRLLLKNYDVERDITQILSERITEAKANGRIRLTKELLEELYLNKNMTAKQISQETGYDTVTINKYIQKFRALKRGVSGKLCKS